VKFSAKELKKLENNKKLLQDLFDAQVLNEKKFKKEVEYEQQLLKSQYELVKLQDWVENNRKRILIIFEGRDTAGKGGTIKRFIEFLDPKINRVSALPPPTKEEKGQWYFQRYIKNLPDAGQIMFFDRSWYNRAVVEPVFGFCTEPQYKIFLKQVSLVEKMIIEDGIILIKLFLSISKEEQIKRLKAREDNPLKEWKLGRLDKRAEEKWEDYTHYIRKLFKKTATDYSPWIEIKTDHKEEARLACIRHVLSQIPYDKKTSVLENNMDCIKIHH